MPVVTDGLSRRDLLALGATLAAVGCRSSSPSVDTSLVQPYGAPISRPPPDVPTAETADAAAPPPNNVVAIAAPYGAPPRPLPSQIQWTLSASAERLSLGQRGAWRLRVEARNRGPVAADAGRDALSFVVNGAPSMVANLAFSNGAREARWGALPPGDAVTDERALGEGLLPSAGRYVIALLVQGREVSQVTVVVTPTGAHAGNH